MTNKDNFKIVKIVNTSLFQLQRVGSGAIPDLYKGMYTSPSLAQKDMDKHISEINIVEKVAEDKLYEEERMKLSPRTKKVKAAA